MATYKISKKNNAENLLEKEEKRRDLGFGTKITGASNRLVNVDGSFNVKRDNVPFWSWLNPFHRLTIMSWPKFIMIVFLFFFFTNCLFSSIYLLIGTEHLAGMLRQNKTDDFWEAFFFSAQTLTTVGYGRISPIGHLTSAVASIEALVGLLSFALATGLVYGRFSRPKPHILFSNKALIAPYLDANAFMFRIINLQANELIDMKAEVSISIVEDQKDGTRLRRYYAMHLERSQVVFFPLSWTIVHAITDSSPLFNQTPEKLAEGEAEVLISIKGIEETFLQTVSVRKSYRFSDMVWGAKFVPMFDSSKIEGKVHLDVNDVHEFEIKELNLV